MDDGISRARFVSPLLLVATAFAFWYAGMRLRGGTSILDHSPIDQHTLQAQAWLEGRLDLPKAPRYLEIAVFRGRYYDSFPPTPALVELLLVLFFGRQTPNGLAMYLFWSAALVAMWSMLRDRGFSEASAMLVALSFIFGTNVFVSCVRANVWGWGQGLGFCLTLIGLRLVVANRRRGCLGPTAGYVLLSLAVGCRPFYVFMLPLFVVLDIRTSDRDFRTAARAAALGMAPYCLGLACLNAARFGNPLEFGHSHLDWARSLPNGIFSLVYVPRNLFHAWCQLPTWNRLEWPPLTFDPWGTAFWLNNGIFLFCLGALVRVRFDASIRLASAAGLVLIWSGLLMHQTNGWRQFGYRYLIDLLPIGFIAFLHAYRRFSRGMAAALAWSLIANAYGLMAWKEMPRPY